MKSINDFLSAKPWIRQGIQPQKSLLGRFYYWEKHHPQRVYLRQPYGRQWQEFTFSQVGQEARRLVSYFRSLNLPKGARIALYAENHAYWIIADLAIMMGGYVSVPIYAHIGRRQLLHILQDATPALLLVGRVAQPHLLTEANVNISRLLALPDSNVTNAPAWIQLREQFAPIDASPDVLFEDLYTIIYTSGTTDEPKGVMLSHFAPAICLELNREILGLDQPGRFFSYLPLAHVAERAAVEAFSLECGGCISFCESPESFLANLRDARPTHFLAVPAVWQKLYEGITKRLPKTWLDYAAKVKLLNRAFNRYLLYRLGLADIRVAMTGAAPMPMHLHSFFRQLGLTVREVYGITELSAAVCMHRQSDASAGTVGRPFPAVQMRIDAATGEIQVKAPWMFSGYYANLKKTQASLTSDGYFRTGDRGRLLPNGQLVLEGRLSDSFKTLRGEFVHPARIESLFGINKYIEHVCVLGDGMLQPIALVSLSELARKELDVVLKVGMEITLTRINEQLADYEKIDKVFVAAETWRIDNELLTPSLKIRRHLIEASYRQLLVQYQKRPEKVIYLPPLPR